MTASDATRPPGTPPGRPPTGAGRAADLRLFGLSVLALYLELLVIRWMGAHVLYLSYFSNLVLLACFLGLGAGALAARRSIDLFAALPPLLAILVTLVLAVDVNIRIDSPEAIYFQAGRGVLSVPDFVILPAVFVLVSTLFACVGQPLGRALSGGAPLRLYTLNILGSLVGIGLFTCTAWLRAPAVVWLVLAGAMTTVLLPRRRLWLQVGLLGVACTAVGVAERGDAWSPYYRWSVTDEGESTAGCNLDLCLNEGHGRVTVRGHRLRLKVNSITHQYITDFRQREPFYEFPFLALGRPPGRVMIVGAGNGTDTAFALAYGAGHVDAVEIDPDIALLGRDVNPTRPFADPRVTVVVDDGRAVLERESPPYDLIIFGLPDSLTLASSHASVRLESFLFTVESLRAARRRLAPDGLLVLYNYYREPWLVQKLAGMMRLAFGRDPMVLAGVRHRGTAVLMAGGGQDRIPPALGAAWDFRPLPLEGAAEPATDDWPFLYLRGRSVPAIYLRAVLPIGLFSLLLLGLVAPRGAGRRPDLPFFFMGAAFLLLETVSVVRFALLFGSTWLVNAVVFALILTMVLLANLICARWPIRRPWPLVLALFAALAIQGLVPLHTVLALTGLARLLGAGALVFSPVFLANLLYSRSYRDTGAADRAYAWNLVGAMGGGLLEYAALRVGYAPLLLLVAVLYAAALGAMWWASRRRMAAADTAQA